MIEKLDLATVPREVKSLPNWKLVQISKTNAVCVVGYDSNGNRDSQSTAIVGAARTVKHGGVIYKTASGSYYFQKDSEKQPGLWAMAIYAKRQGVFARLQELNAI